ncbi:MFS transporter [Mycolicibacterium holsaticum]|uniref:MFS transporter n=2 Tax=Mycolicibacterium holsaticum TaxID=152142 RepID=A0A1E3REF8_9MYCO|nr:MFS transporter [Mycolicibacterium holsaticum]ODQ88275.1 MFS transporter [Mycolicibacterium holsaticum]
MQPTTTPPSTSLWSRQFVGVVIAIGGVLLMAFMDGPVAVYALPQIQDELGLSNASRSWVITAYVVAFGGLMLLGGRLGDTFGRKRVFISGIALFTLASALCGFAWDGPVLVAARFLHGAAAAIVAPTAMALIVTTFPKGPVRNAAAGVFGAMSGVGAVVGLVVGPALTEVSWRLAFLVNVPIGILVIYLAITTLRETQSERMKLDAKGAVLGTLASTAAVFSVSIGPEQGWDSGITIGSGVVALVSFVAFLLVERTAENPILPFSLFSERNRLAIYGAMFLVGGVSLTLAVLVSLYVQTIMGYSPLRAGISFIPFAAATTVGVVAASRLVTWFPPRAVVATGATFVAAALLYGSTLNGGVPYFPNLLVPIVLGGIGIGLINVPLTLSLVASVGFDRIGPASAVALMLQTLGGPLVLVIVQAAVTVRTLHLGGTSGPPEFMNAAQLGALDQGLTYGLLWLVGAVVLLGVAALFIGYTAQDVARVQEARKTANETEDA